MFPDHVGRDLNEPLNLQRGAANAFLRKTRCISTSNERYTSLANKPCNLWANVDNFTRGTCKPEMTLGKLRVIRVSNGWFAECLPSACSTLQPLSNTLKLQLTTWNENTQTSLPPICSHPLLSFLNNFPWGALSLQPGLPQETHPFCTTALGRDARGLPHWVFLQGVCYRLRTVSLAHKRKLLGHGWNKSCTKLQRYLPPSTLIFVLKPKGVREAAREWQNAGAAWNHTGHVKGQGLHSWRIPASRHFTSTCYLLPSYK